MNVMGQNNFVYAELILKPQQPLQPELQKIISHCYQKITAAQAFLVANPDDPEALHELRVNIRQLRSFLSFIKPLLIPDGYIEVQTSLRRLAQQFGLVRELDALLESWQSFSLAHPELLPSETNLGQILLTERQREAVEPVNKLSWDESQITLESTQSWIVQSIAQMDQKLFKHLEDFAAYRCKKQLTKINRQLMVADFRNRSQVHPLRIRIKKLRYALYLLEPIVKPKHRKLIPQLKELQQKLGQICDAPRNIAILMELGARHPGDILWYESGLLIGYQSRGWEVIADEMPGLKLT